MSSIWKQDRVRPFGHITFCTLIIIMGLTLFRWADQPKQCSRGLYDPLNECFSPFSFTSRSHHNLHFQFVCLFPFTAYSWELEKAFKTYKASDTVQLVPNHCLEADLKASKRAATKETSRRHSRVMKSELPRSLHFDRGCSFTDDGFSSNRICIMAWPTVSHLSRGWVWVESFQEQNDFWTSVFILRGIKLWEWNLSNVAWIYQSNTSGSSLCSYYQ